jgi:hypothetical protein
MQQWALRPATSVGHAVSPDLLHWNRVDDVLASGMTGDQQCYDGSASIVRRDGTVTPMLMIDGGCGKRIGGSHPCMESSGNGSQGGVTSFPDDLSDPKLVHWTKIGPTTFEGCDGSAGPSPIWQNTVNGKFNLLAIHGGGEARFSATDNSLTSWKMADPKFMAERGGGGGLWHQLPQNVDNVTTKPWVRDLLALLLNTPETGRFRRTIRLQTPTF